MLMSCTTKIPVLTFAVLDESFSLSVEEIHSVGTINNVETSYFTQLIMLPNDNVSMSVRHLDHVLFAARSNNHVLLFQGRHILTDVRCHYGKPWSPVSPLLANLFMEWLEKQAIATAPFECKPKFFEVVCGRCFGTDNEGSSEEPYGVRTTLTPLIPLATSSSPTKRRRTSRSHFWTLF